jgi:hypothetical protein
MSLRLVSGLFAAGFLYCSFSSASLAADGSSGCGPGWFVFKQNSLVSSSLRMTTNGILWPSVTVGMTLGTSNCAKHSIVQRSHRSLHFAAFNSDILAVEMAQAQGETLSAYAAAWGCSWTTQDRFNAVMQANYDHIFMDPAVKNALGRTDASALNDRVAGAIANDPVLVAACQAS